jgi:hypothetical protein
MIAIHLLASVGVPAPFAFSCASQRKASALVAAASQLGSGDGSGI